MQEEAAHEEHAIVEYEQPIEENDSRRSTNTSEDDTAKESAYKLGLDAKEWDVEDDNVELLASTDPGLEEFNDQFHEELHKGKGCEEGPVARNASQEAFEEFEDGHKIEELKSIKDEDSDDEGSSPSFNHEDDMSVVITVGMELPNFDMFKIAVSDLNISIGKEVDFVKNDSNMVRAVCVKRNKDKMNNEDN
ncbi:hypothetical protein CRG98_014699 [Punica granatum]|uniref:Transposase MuDR plant domain-containing protein n=1 Tax=Punica granatum TaxID=22663 RepID=A0A2I0K9W6_PUNGR|nr:hypothetical protein CRG98_014699 [Punica granatum]